jgi:hypothetical protein
MEEHFRQHLGTLPEADPEAILAQTAREVSNPFTSFDSIFLLAPEGDDEGCGQAHARLHDLDIGWRTETWPLKNEPHHHDRACVQAWRALVAEVDRRGHQHVVGFEGDIPRSGPGGAPLHDVVDGLAGSTWGVCLLSTGATQTESGPCHRTMAIHRRAFARILADVPGDGPELDAFLDRHPTLDHYLQEQAESGSLRVLSSARPETVPA